MKKIRRIVLIVLGAILAVAILILLGVNLYVQSQGTQARIQQELSQRLGTTLHIRRISVTPWAGLKLSGITIPQTQPGVSANFLTAKTFQLRIKFRSLFSQRLVIKEISLINPDVVWAQNADGKWRFPSLPPPPAPAPVVSAPQPEKIEPAAPPLPSVPAPTEAAPVVVEKKEMAPAPPVVAPPEPPSAPVETEKTPAFTPEVQRVNLSGGRFLFLDEKLKQVAMFEAVRFRSNFRTATDLRGSISIEKTSLQDRFFLEQFQSDQKGRYGCPDCDKNLHYNNLRQHLLDFHEKYHCMNCLKFFDYEDEMANHRCQM